MDKSVGVIDGKYIFAGRNPITGRGVTEFNGMVFLATDLALPATLQFYRESCARQGASPEVIESLSRLIERVVKFQDLNPELCKIADLSTAEAVAMGLQPPEPVTTASDDGPITPDMKDEPATEPVGQDTPVGDPGEGGLGAKKEPGPNSEPAGL